MTSTNRPGRLHSSTSVRRSTRTIRGVSNARLAGRLSTGPSGTPGGARGIADRAIELRAALTDQEDVGGVDLAAADRGPAEGPVHAGRQAAELVDRGRAHGCTPVT